MITFDHIVKVFFVDCCRLVAAVANKKQQQQKQQVGQKGKKKHVEIPISVSFHGNNLCRVLPKTAQSARLHMKGHNNVRTNYTETEQHTKGTEILLLCLLKITRATTAAATTQANYLQDPKK